MNLPEFDRIKTKIFGISERNEKEIKTPFLPWIFSARASPHFNQLIKTLWRSSIRIDLRFLWSFYWESGSSVLRHGFSLGDVHRSWCYKTTWKRLQWVQWKSCWRTEGRHNFARLQSRQSLPRFSTVLHAHCFKIVKIYLRKSTKRLPRC